MISPWTIFFLSSLVAILFLPCRLSKTLAVTFIFLLIHQPMEVRKINRISFLLDHAIRMGARLFFDPDIRHRCFFFFLLSIRLMRSSTREKER